MTENIVMKLESAFEDIITVAESKNKYLVYINGGYGFEFVELDIAKEFAETKKSELDFRHVVINAEGVTLDVGVYESMLTPVDGTKVVKISRDEADKMGLEKVF